MARTVWQLLVADDEGDICNQVKEYLDGEVLQVDGNEHLAVETLTDFDGVIDALEYRRVDVLILDVRMQLPRQEGELEAGERILEEVRRKRFVPVIFYTGLPHLVEHLQSPLVCVMEKTEGLEKLHENVNKVIETGLTRVNRALIHHMEAVQRDYMWNFVADNWDGFAMDDDRMSLAYLLARRLATSLSGPGIQRLASDLGGTAAPGNTEETVHPMQLYVLPPVAGQPPQTGSLFQGDVNGQDGYWILLTPSCDMVQEKADWVTFAFCESLEDQSEFRTWRNSLPDPSVRGEERLTSLLRNNRRGSQPERFHFLPGVLTLPNLIADFQQLRILPRDELGKLDHVATLDSPFAESLLARFARYFGRLGTPDLDVVGLLSRLTSEAVSNDGE